MRGGKASASNYSRPQVRANTAAPCSRIIARIPPNQFSTLELRPGTRYQHASLKFNLKRWSEVRVWFNGRMWASQA